jgi:hypothetical protein
MIWRGRRNHPPSSFRKPRSGYPESISPDIHAVRWIPGSLAKGSRPGMTKRHLTNSNEAITQPSLLAAIGKLRDSARSNESFDSSAS